MERGTRSTAIDRYLHDIALDMGVTFEWGNPIRTQKDLVQYPPNTIVATGPYIEAFEALNIPYQMAGGYVMSAPYKPWGGEKSFARHCAVYFDYYTKDYCYMPTANGICGRALLRPPPHRRGAACRLGAAAQGDGGHGVQDLVSPSRGYFASRYPNQPKLFAGNKILAGTLAGAQDPGHLFRVPRGHGLREDRGHRPGGQGGGPGDVRLHQPQLQPHVGAAPRGHQLLARFHAPLGHDHRAWGMVAKSPALGKMMRSGTGQAMIPGYLLLKNMDKYSRYIDI